MNSATANPSTFSRVSFMLGAKHTLPDGGARTMRRLQCKKNITIACVKFGRLSSMSEDRLSECLASQDDADKEHLSAFPDKVPPVLTEIVKLLRYAMIRNSPSLMPKTVIFCKSTNHVSLALLISLHYVCQNVCLCVFVCVHTMYTTQ